MLEYEEIPAQNQQSISTRPNFVLKLQCPSIASDSLHKREQAKFRRAYFFL
jgi:hypothetical protein